jgi:hypothetical protein
MLQSKKAADIRLSPKIRKRPVVKDLASVGDNYERGTFEVREIVVFLADILNRLR